MRCSTEAFVEWYAGMICKFRKPVLVFWVLLAGGSAYFIMQFIQNTSQEFSPPPGTQAAEAEDAFALDFPQTHDVSYMNVFVQLFPAIPAPIVEVPAVQDFSAAVLAAFRARFGNSIASLSDYFELVALNMTTSATHLVSHNGRAMAIPLVLKANFVAKIAETYGDDMQSIVSSLTWKLAGNATAVCNGIPIFVKGIVKNAQDELGTMDAIAIPLALFIMSITLKSLRMMILPIVTIGFTLAISFGAMYFISLAMAVSSTTPSLMMSMCIAMSIDYNLFILSRYREELIKGSSGVNCVTNVLRTAGHTILVSGVTLLFCLMGLVFFPLNMLQSFGVGCGFSISVALLVSLSFAPALLLTFPTFFENSIQPTAFPSWFPKRVADFFNKSGYTYEDYISSAEQKTAALPTVSPGPSRTNFTSRVYGTDQQQDGNTLATNASGYHVSPEGSRLTSGSDLAHQRLLSPTNEGNPDFVTSLQAQYYHRTRSAFYRLHVILRFPWNVMVFLSVIAVTIALGYAVLDFKTTDSFESYLPRGSDVSNNFMSFVDSFGYGYTQPYHIMLSGRGGSAPDGPLPHTPNATSEAFFFYFQGFLKVLVADTLVAPTETSDFLGPLNIGKEWTNYSQLFNCLFPLQATAPCSPNVGGFLVAPNNMIQLSDVPSAMYTILITSFDPMGNLGDPYYKHVMALAKSYQAGVLSNATRYLENVSTAVTPSDLQAVASHYVIYFAGVGPSSMDAIDTVYKLFPVIIGVSCGAVLLVVGIAFRSIVMPLRSIVSIAATQLFVFGLTVLTYQTPGILDWTGWGSVQSFGAVSWTAPIVAFSVIVGVALDYDIFLITRIVELVQEEKLSTNDAVLHALCSTGRIITSAGIIMAVAFFGLLLSSTQILNLLGFFMVCAVLFDTFVVRTLLVPSLMSILGRWNWYPRDLDKT